MDLFTVGNQTVSLSPEITNLAQTFGIFYIIWTCIVLLFICFVGFFIFRNFISFNRNWKRRFK